MQPSRIPKPRARSSRTDANKSDASEGGVVPGAFGASGLRRPGFASRRAVSGAHDDSAPVEEASLPPPALKRRPSRRQSRKLAAKAAQVASKAETKGARPPRGRGLSRQGSASSRASSRGSSRGSARWGDSDSADEAKDSHKHTRPEEMPPAAIGAPIAIENGAAPSTKPRRRKAPPGPRPRLTRAARLRMARTKAERAAAAATGSRRGPRHVVTLSSLDMGVLAGCVFPFLTVRELIRVESACKYLKAAADQDASWHGVLSRAAIKGFVLDDPASIARPLKHRYRAWVLSRRQKRMAKVRNHMKKVRQRRGVHALIDCVKFLDLTYEVTVNGRLCKLVPMPKNPGVRMRRGEPGRTSSHATPGRFGGKAAGRRDKRVRMFPSSLMLKAMVPASMEHLKLRECNTIVVSARSEKLGRSRDLVRMHSWQRYSVPSEVDPSMVGWKKPVVSSVDGSLQLHQFVDNGLDSGPSEEHPAAAGRRRAFGYRRAAGGRAGAGAGAGAGDAAGVKAGGASAFKIAGVVGGSSVWVGVWGGTDVHFFIVSLSFGDILARMTRIPGIPHQPLIDDVDTMYGLHDFHINVTLRSLGKICWEGAYQKQDAEPLGAAGGSLTIAERAGAGKRVKSRHNAAATEGAAVVWLLRPDATVTGGGRQLYAAPVMHWTTEAMAGVYERSAVLDFTVWDEHFKPMWAVSQLVPLRTVDGGADGGASGINMEVDMSVDRGTRYSLVVAGAQGRMCVELAEVDEQYGQRNLADRDFGGGPGRGGRQYSGKPLVVRALWLELRLEFVDEWFGTSHTTTPTRGR